MNPMDLAEAASKALAEPDTRGMPIVVKKGRLPRGFPRGRLLNQRENGDRLYLCDPRRVMDWLVRHGLVQVERPGDTRLMAAADEVLGHTDGSAWASDR
jgi:hypothetical protein